jgi:ceramide glucosyltransferase
MSLLYILSWLFLGLAVVGVAYTLLAAWLVTRLPRRPPPVPAEFPAMTVLKPLHGLEPELEKNLESFFVQEYAAPFQLVFGVQNPSDPAIAVVERLCARYPQVDAALIVSARSLGFNAKVSNLANMREAARHGVLVASDSDIAVTPDYLRKLAAVLAGSNVGAVSCLYTGWAPAGGLGARLSAMGIDYHFLPNVVTGLTLGLASPCMGSTIALGAEMLDQCGGYEAFADYLADDYELGRAVREHGYRVVIPSFAVRHACAEENLSAWLGHELRWARTIRVNDFLGHLGSIVTQPLPLALLGAIFSGFSVISLWTLGATLVARAVLKWRIDESFGCRGGPLWLLPARDVLAFGVFLASLFGSRISWRGMRLTVAHGGRLWRS